MNFNQYYQSLYGQRWQDILAAFSMETPKVARFAPACEETLKFVPFSSHPEFSDCFYPPDVSTESEARLYYLDFASVVAARALNAQAGQRVLDMCAAPGGKSLVLAHDMSYKGSLVCNEPSRSRRERLKKVLRQHIAESPQLDIKVRGLDGAVLGMKERESFDSILVDAPCSGERHLVADPKQLEGWSIKRTKRLAARQYGLLCSALLALAPSGQLVYSTCALSDHENDLVLERFLKKKGDHIELDNEKVWERWRDLTGLERTAFGLRFLPDRADGMGPIYFSRMLKKT